MSLLDSAGQPQGMTANSFTSVSLEPPLILVCIDHKARLMEHVDGSAAFAVNILRESQQELSTHFARPGENRFEATEWYAGESGMPLIPGALATLECRMVQRIAAGDHTILLGEVVSAIRHEGRPLVYFNSSYQQLGPL